MEKCYEKKGGGPIAQWLFMHNEPRCNPTPHKSLQVAERREPQLEILGELLPIKMNHTGLVGSIQTLGSQMLSLQFPTWGSRADLQGVTEAPFTSMHLCNIKKLNS